GRHAPRPAPGRRPAGPPPWHRPPPAAPARRGRPRLHRPAPRRRHSRRRSPPQAPRPPQETSDMILPETPPAHGLYDPRYEHDACGVGLVVDLNGRPSHDIVAKALQVLLSLEHRGACGCETNTGDGAGILVQTPHAFLQKECEALGIRLPGPGEYGV